MKLATLLTALTLAGACIGSKDWHIGAILGPVACGLCFMHGYATGSAAKRKQLYKLWKIHH